MNNKKNLHGIVARKLLELGVNPSLSGYAYLVDAIELVCMDKTYLQQITKRLYVEVALRNDSTVQRVERSMRHAIEVLFQNANLNHIDKYFNGFVSYSSGKVTASTFIAVVAENILLSMADDEGVC